jgi:hypothetical protein
MRQFAIQSAIPRIMIASKKRMECPQITGSAPQTVYPRLLKPDGGPADICRTLRNQADLDSNDKNRDLSVIPADPTGGAEEITAQLTSVGH